MNIDLSQLEGAPWWAVLISIILTTLFTFLATRTTSKDKLKGDMVTQTVIRQEQLDKRTTNFIDDMQEELLNLRKDLSLIREELFEERRKSSQLEAKMTELEKENISLRAENEELRQLDKELQEKLKKLGE